MTAQVLQHPQSWPRRVAIARGGRLVRAGLRALLESQPAVAVVGECGDGEHAVEMARRLRPDSVVLDVNLPGLDWMAVTRRVVAESSVAVIVLVPSWSHALASEAFLAGAARVVPEDQEPAELFDAVGRRHEIPKENDMVTPNVIELRRGSARGKAVAELKPVPAVRLVKALAGADEQSRGGQRWNSAI